ncbi:hypothetical protein [Candidatus Viridilinea mediisalina]|uniref:Type II secretion system protein GspE N-terminal domain-containing protein n=1 Tax=Candidatus Viridilinea mediisalina TaxID=2024553 RepID=A0A2A6RGZ6_9CHLR|nr:hypothetical protein [Candidatus Viridilinea mediisalina]PDW02130.1 hypothetical protein CJ255_15570 [Candidatus Viridilinea mediisalina]
MANFGPTADVFASVAHMLAETKRVEPPRHRAWAMPAERAKMPLGSYLLGHGYIRPNELVQALTLQQQMASEERCMLLGDIMVARGLISPQILATMLAVQLMDRLVDPTPFKPVRLGEHLVARHLIKPRHLAGVLQLQAWLRTQGQAVLVGQLLVQQNLVQPQHIEEIVSVRSSLSS